jgi:O-antigen/teichoic acid export membrane protein
MQARRSGENPRNYGLMAEIASGSAAVERFPARPAAVPTLTYNFSWTLAGNVFYAACQWGMLALMTKLSTAATVGQFALGLAITAPIFMLTNLQLRGVQATDVHSEFAFSDYFTLRCSTTGLALLLVVAISLLWIHDRTVGWVSIAIAISKSIESLSDAVAGRLQKVERLDRVAVALALRGAASLLSFAGVFAVYRSLLLAASAAAISALAVFLGYDVVQARHTLPSGETFFRLQPATLSRLSRLALPLGMVMGMGSLMANAPRYVLEAAWGTAELGIFASLAYLVTAVSFIVNALGQSATARLGRMFATGDLASFNRLLWRFTAFGAVLGILGVAGALLLGRPLLSLLYEPQYGNYPRLLAVMLATAGVSAIGSFLGYGMTAARCFRAQVPIVGISTGIAVGASLLLVPGYGLYGAAVAWLAAASAQAGLSSGFLHFRLRPQEH